MLVFQTQTTAVYTVAYLHCTTTFAISFSGRSDSHCKTFTVVFFNCSTVVGEEGKESTSFLSGVGHFFTMFIGSALIGIAFALLSALVSLRNLTII